jgi:Fasciclin domain
VNAAGLVDTLSGKGPFTVFAPTDKAFAKLHEKTLKDLLKPENKDRLASIFRYHVFATEATSAAVAKMIKDDNGAHPIRTVSGGKINAKMDGDNITLTDESGNTARSRSPTSSSPTASFMSSIRCCYRRAELHEWVSKFTSPKKTGRPGVQTPGPFCSSAVATQGRRNYKRMRVPAIERGRLRTRPPSLPDCTSQRPSDARPTICPTW